MAQAQRAACDCRVGAAHRIAAAGRRLAPVPILLVALAFIPGGGGRQLPDAKLTEEGRRLAEREGHKLAERKLDAEKMKALDTDEKQELEKLQQRIAETAKSLGQEEAG